MPTAVPSPRRVRASSLVTTLFVVVVLSTIVLAFLQSMTLEKQISRSLKNQFQAELAAEAGVNTAIQRLKDYLLTYPYHGVGYATVGNQTITVLSGKGNYTDSTAPVTRYLLSVDSPSASLGALTANNSTALNYTNKSSPSGWMGSPVTANGTLTYRECRAPWIYQAQDPSRPHQPDRSQANYNPYVYRYAFWIEDESSKLDFTIAGNTNASSGGYLRPILATNALAVDLGASPLVAGKPLATNASVTNALLIAFRDQVTNALGSTTISPKNLSHHGTFGENAANTSRFYTTSASHANDLAGTGCKRININALVTEGLSAADITGDLQDIIYAITGNQVTTLGINGTSRVLSGLPNINSPLPNFGNRFFATITPNASQRDIYLKKIAANIRDYIDSDSQPTFINSSGLVVSGTRPMDCWPTTQWPQAIGKETAPFYTEHAMVGIEKAWTTGNPSRGSLKIDHYIEFSNPSTKDYTAPAGSFVRLTNLMSWKAGSYPWIEPDDFEMDISGITFPAGSAIIITTNMNPADDPPGLVLNAANLFRRTTNPTTNTTQFGGRFTDELISGTRGFQADARDSNSGSAIPISDFQTRLVLGNMNGIVAGLPAVGFSPSNNTLPFNFKGQNLNNLTRFVYSTGLRGNAPQSSAADSRTGDPRSVSEQIGFQGFNSNFTTGAGENTRFYGAIQGTGVILGQATLGRINSKDFVDPERLTGIGRWPDYTQQFNETASTAYAVISDQTMSSIGELGYIYDPGQRIATTTIEAARGGGRTLKIGQPDDSIGTAARFSTSWQNAAWRLTDVFGVSSNRTQVELEPTSRGKININSVARDDGVVLKSLLRSFVFPASPVSDAGTAGRLLRSDEVDRLVTSVKSYLTSNGPMLERGELSQVAFFSGNTTNLATAGSQAVRLTADRSREQIFRSLVEMITTRSASFAVYSVGEILQETDAGVIKPLGRAYKGAVYTITPAVSSALRAVPTGYIEQKVYDIE